MEVEAARADEVAALSLISCHVHTLGDSPDLTGAKIEVFLDEFKSIPAGQLPQAYAILMEQFRKQRGPFSPDRLGAALRHLQTLEPAEKCLALQKEVVGKHAELGSLNKEMEKLQGDLLELDKQADRLHASVLSDLDAQRQQKKDMERWLRESEAALETSIEAHWRAEEASHEQHRAAMDEQERQRAARLAAVDADLERQLAAVGEELAAETSREAQAAQADEAAWLAAFAQARAAPAAAPAPPAAPARAPSPPPPPGQWTLPVVSRDDIQLLTVDAAPDETLAAIRPRVTASLRVTGAWRFLVQAGPIPPAKEGAMALTDYLREVGGSERRIVLRFKDEAGAAAGGGAPAGAAAVTAPAPVSTAPEAVPAPQAPKEGVCVVAVVQVTFDPLGKVQAQEALGEVAVPAQAALRELRERMGAQLQRLPAEWRFLVGDGTAPLLPKKEDSLPLRECFRRGAGGATVWIREKT